MKLPRLLIIGAMKAGTTGLYMDLATHRQVYLSHDKEPHSLCHDAVLTASGRERYAAIYAGAAAEQLCCDASTGYTKRPDFEGVAQRAVQVLPEGFKVAYVVRHPIDRIVSQHHHEHAEGKVGPSIDDAIRQYPRYVQYSRYSYQLQPWLDSIGRERIHVIRFEDYVACREAEVGRLCTFLGLDPQACAIDDEAVYNKSHGKPVKTRFWNAVQHNGAYRRLVRPLAPVKLRLAIRRALFPKAPDKLLPPSSDTTAYLRESVADDVAQLSRVLGLQGPLWNDFDARSPSLQVAQSKA
jgi:hypothetical protein